MENRPSPPPCVEGGYVSRCHFGGKYENGNEKKQNKLKKINGKFDLGGKGKKVLRMRSEHSRITEEKKYHFRRAERGDCGFRTLEDVQAT
jgi:hypothetical protein